MTSRPDRAIWLPLALLLCAGCFLVLKAKTGSLGNFAPAMALAFTGSILLPPRFRVWAPLAIVAAADIVISGASLAEHWGSILLKWSLLAAAAFWGLRFLARPSIPRILGGCLVCSLGFYLAMNTGSWIANPAYAKTFGGWIQANTTGEPGFLPAWLFLRNGILSDQVFSLLLILLFNREAAWKGLPRLSWKRLEPAPA